MFGLLTPAPSTATNNRKGLSQMAVTFILCGLIALVGACSERKPGTTTAPTANPAEQRKYPQPPAPMTSATQILSGGWVLSGDGSKPEFDSIVVIRGGIIVGVGKRGSVDVPADSVGVDASGKWILPGSSALLSKAFGERKHDQPMQFASTALPAIGVGRNADLVMLNSNPLTDPQALEDVHAIVRAGQVEVQIESPSNDPS